MAKELGKEGIVPYHLERLLRYCGDIDEATVNDFIVDDVDGLRKKIESGEVPPGDVHLVIKCKGGSISEAWAVFDCIKNFPFTVHTVAEGAVGSAGLLIFLAGQKRYISSKSELLLEPVFIYSSNFKKEHEYTDVELHKIANLITRENDKMIALYVKATGQDEDVIRQLFYDKEVLQAEEAVQYGFAHEILRGDD